MILTCNRLTHFIIARNQPDKLSKIEESNILIKLAPYVESFFSDLFGIQQQVKTSHLEQATLNPIYTCKRFFIQRRAAKNLTNVDLKNINPEIIRLTLQKIFKKEFCDLAFAYNTLEWLKDEKLYESNINLALVYARWAILTEEGRFFHRNSILFKLPKKISCKSNKLKINPTFIF